MMNTNEELSSGLNAIDCSFKNECSCKDENTRESVLQKPRYKLRIAAYRVYNLRKNPEPSRVNQLPSGSNYLSEFCKLVCKPVSVSLVRLSDQDLKKLGRKISSNVESVRRPSLDNSQHKFYGYERKKRKSTISIKTHSKDGKQIHIETESNKINKNVDNNVNENVQKNVDKNAAQKQPKPLCKKHQLRSTVTSKVQRSSKNEQCKKDLLKTIKQPIIVLNRIDEVINKLAQSFARVTSNKQYCTVEQSTVKQHIAVTQTEEVGLIPEPSLISTNGNNCLQNDSVADNISEADSNDIPKIKRKSRRKNKIFDDTDSEDDNDGWYEAKKGRWDFPGQEIAITADKCNEDVQVRTSQEVCISSKLNEVTSEKIIERNLAIQNVEVNNKKEGMDLENINIDEVQEKLNVQDEDVNVENEGVNIENEGVNIKNEYVDVENEDVDVENEDVDVENKDIDVENEDVDIENEDIDVENEDIDVENEDVDVENEDIDVENEDVDVENEDIDVEEGNLDIQSVETNNRNKEVDVEVQNEADDENGKESFEYEDAGVKGEEVDVETENGRCSLDASEDVIQEISSLSSELCFEHTSKHDACSVDESVHKNSEMQQYILKPLLSENELIQKYKLYKQPKICLVDCQHIKIPSGNTYSVMEVKKLTEKNINILLNSNVTHTTKNDLISDMSCSKNMTVKSKFDKSVYAHKIQRGRKGSVERESVFKKSITPKKGRIYKMTSDSIIGHGIVSPYLSKQSIKQLNTLSFTYPQKPSRLFIKLTEITTKKAILITSNTIAIKTNMTGKNFLNNTKHLYVLGHASSPNKNQSEDIRIGNCKTDIEKAMLSCVYITSPTKHKKLAEKKDTIKSKEVSSTYKCIVCDLFFEEYVVLQQHLSTHTKQCQQKAKKKLLFSLLTPEKDLQQSPIEDSTSQVASSCRPCIDGDQTESRQKSLHKKIKEAKSKQSLSRKHKLCRPSKLTNECSVCKHEFPTESDLAAHIFLHTELELQEACDAENLNKQENDVNIPESDTRRANNSVTKPTHSVEKSPMNLNESKTSSLETPPLQNHKEHIPKDVKSIDEKASMISKLNHRESNSNIQIPCGTRKALFKICQCHNVADTNFGCLRIEIVLLCHTCGVLFRSMECFETHYRLPEYSVCNQNRAKSGRSPNLFCATCGMIFSSVQDVRQHLEMHVRFKKDCKMDFRCNICKVMFIGIGPLFYRHWVNHTKDPFWLASKQSFPKISLLNLTSKKLSVASNPGEFVTYKCLDNYIYVAEYVCSKCKTVFNAEDHLKVHEPNCKEVNAKVKPIKWRLICKMCKIITRNKTELYEHMKSRHKHAANPQFVKSLTNTALAFICKICMASSATIEEFNEHWFDHYMSRPWFQCSYCMLYCQNLDVLEEHLNCYHAEVLKNIKDIVAITSMVLYRKVKHICQLCCTGFISEELLNEHNNRHDPGSTFQLGNSNKATIKKYTSMLENLTDQVSDKGDEDAGEQADKGDPQTEDVTDKEVEVLKEQINKGDQATEEKIDERNHVMQEQTAQCSKSKADLEREKLINTLEGNEEEDSENELVIDLTDHTESQNELAVTDRFKEKQIVSTGTVGTLNTTSQPIPPPNKPTETNNATKQVHGFLRVKKLEDLLEDISTLHECKACKYACGSVEELQEHLLTHAVQKQAKVSSEGTSQQLVNFTEQNIDANKLPQNGQIVFGKTVQIPILSNLYPGTATNVKLLTTKHIPPVSSSQASVKTAYHKNLPACNIFRKLTIPSSFIRSIEKVPTAVESGSPNAQSLPTAPRVDSDTRNRQNPVNTSVCKTNSHTPHRTNVPRRDNVGTVRSKNKYINQLEGYNTYSKPIPAMPTTYTYSKDENGKIKVFASHSIDNAVANNNANYTNGNQSYIQTSHNIQNQVRSNNPPTTMYSQYPNSNTVYTTNGQGPVQPQQMAQQVPNQTLAPTVSPAFYCKNPTAGGMSIVINQNAPSMQSLPVVDVRQQQGQQQHIYQPVYSNPVVSVDPYVAQSQNIIDYSGTGEIYQVTSNEYSGPVNQNVPSCDVSLQTTPTFFCTYCPTVVSFVSEELYNIHMSVYHNFVCEICDLSFYHVEDMRVHKMKHGLN
ncbi:uncharacterized protein LOC144476681 [Augochlora pura]